MTASALYLPTASRLHRLSPRVKLASLAVAETAILASNRNTFVLLVAAGAAVLLYAAARVPLRVAWNQLRAVLVLAVVVAAAQSFALGPRQGGVLGAQIFVGVALAALVTLTTRGTELLDAVEAWCAPLRRFGVDPTRVALVLGLAIRSGPVVASLAADVREAHRARGVPPSLVGLAVPLTIRTLRHAEHLGEALVSRGLDD